MAYIDCYVKDCRWNDNEELECTCNRISISDESFMEHAICGDYEEREHESNKENGV